MALRARVHEAGLYYQGSSVLPVPDYTSLRVCFLPQQTKSGSEDIIIYIDNIFLYIPAAPGGFQCCTAYRKAGGCNAPRDAALP